MPSIRTRRVIDIPGADAVIAAAEARAAETGARVVSAVVAPSGELLALRRTPGAQIASSRVAVDKARTAAIFVRPSREIEEQVSGGRLGALALHGAKARTAAIYRRPSKDFEEQASNGRPSALHLARAVPLQGGVPIVWNGEVIGAIGVSGASSADEDQELAVAGAAAAFDGAALRE